MLFLNIIVTKSKILLLLIIEMNSILKFHSLRLILSLLLKQELQTIHFTMLSTHNLVHSHHERKLTTNPKPPLESSYKQSYFIIINFLKKFKINKLYVVFNNNHLFILNIFLKTKCPQLGILHMLNMDTFSYKFICVEMFFFINSVKISSTLVKL